MDEQEEVEGKGEEDAPWARSAARKSIRTTIVAQTVEGHAFAVGPHRGAVVAVPGGGAAEDELQGALAAWARVLCGHTHNTPRLDET